VRLDELEVGLPELAPELAGLRIAHLSDFHLGVPSPGGRAVERAVDGGAIGVKIVGGHQPFTPDATAEIIRAASERRAYVAFHVGTTEHGSNLEGLREAAELADGLSLHVAHVNSYCRGMILDSIDEAREALEILTRWPRLRSESYLALINGTSGRCLNGAPVSNVTKSCLRMRGYDPTEDGLERALLEGYALVADARGDETVMLRGEPAFELWRELGTDVGLSFPVNDPTSQFLLATARHPDGRYVVDALSTDGGGIPRNLTVELGLALVAFGALSLAGFVRKACLAPARMIGLDQKGHLGVGADADAALIDQSRRRVRATIAGGLPIMLHGVVVGSGGTLVTTARGERSARRTGLPVRVVDLERSALYRPEAIAELYTTTGEAR
jgi:hypothetical protein